MEASPGVLLGLRRSCYGIKDLPDELTDKLFAELRTG